MNILILEVQRLKRFFLGNLGHNILELFSKIILITSKTKRGV